MRRIGLLLFVGVLILVACDSSQERSVNAVAQMTALQQMELAFEGGYTQQQIKPRLDKALQLYGLPITEENYKRAGSVLVALREHYGTKEMDILDYMIRSYVPGGMMLPLLLRSLWQPEVSSFGLTMAQQVIRANASRDSTHGSPLAPCIPSDSINLLKFPCRM